MLAHAPDDADPQHEVSAMRTRHLIVAIYVALFATMFSGCLSNPTPHPGTEDNNGFSGSGEATGAGGSTGSRTEDPAAAGTIADAGATPGPNEADNDAGSAEPTDGAGPDTEELECEELVQVFPDALLEFQGCETDEDCVLLVDENDCDCTRAIAVSDLDGALALMEFALSCATDEGDVLGYCESDTAPLGNSAFCDAGSCQADTPGESCLSGPEQDTWTSPDDDITTAPEDAEEGDAGPDEEDEPDAG